MLPSEDALDIAFSTGRVTLERLDAVIAEETMATARPAWRWRPERPSSA